MNEVLLFPPVPGVQVHASSLLVLDDGSFLVAWFAGSHEGATDTSIHVMRSVGAATEVVEVAPHDELPHWNPVLAGGPDGKLWLFFKRGWRIDEWTTWVCRSDDRGLTWSMPREMVPGDTSGGRGPVRQAPLPSGDLWIAAGSVEEWETPRWDCFMDVTADRGRTWQRVGIPLDHASVPGAGCIQPCLVQSLDGTLVALARSTAGAVFRSATRTPYSWPPLQPVDLPNNNSGIAAVALPDGRIVACHNEATTDWGARSTLVLSESRDAGLTWERKHVVVDGSAALTDDSSPPADGTPTSASASGVVTSGDGEFSYPSMVLVGPELWLTYSWQRRSIALVRVGWNSAE